MTDVIEMIDPVTGEIIDEQQLAEQLLKQAKEQGVDLVGPDGVLNGLTKRVLETALEAEMTEHLGYEKHGHTIAENARNGIRSKTVLTEVGPVEIDVPRDREGSFEPKIVEKRTRSTRSSMSAPEASTRAWRRAGQTPGSRPTTLRVGRPTAPEVEAHRAVMEFKRLQVNRWRLRRGVHEVRKLLGGVRDIVFPSRGTVRQISYRYLLLFIVAPLVGAALWLYLDLATHVALYDPGVIASSFGVLGGLLFAHAIFVFQLRVTYDTAGVEPPAHEAQEDLRVRPLIDEMFTGVLYASLVALVLTLVTSGLAATLDPDAQVAPAAATAIVLLALHLGGCVWHVIAATTTAYSTLKKQPRR